MRPKNPTSLYVNKHLIKRWPLYIDQYGRCVKLVRVNKTDDGLDFTTQIVEGIHEGKLSGSSKKDLTLMKDWYIK